MTTHQTHTHTCSGFSGVTANFFPWLIVWMCNNVHAPEEKRSKVQQFLSVSDRVIAHKYPTSSKHYLATYCRVPIQPVSRYHDVTINDQDVSFIGTVHEASASSGDPIFLSPAGSSPSRNAPNDDRPVPRNVYLLLTYDLLTLVTSLCQFCIIIILLKFLVL